MATSKTEIQILFKAINKTNNIVSKIAEDTKKLSASQTRAAQVGEQLKRSQDRVNQTVQRLASAQTRAAQAGQRFQAVQQRVHRQMVASAVVARRMALGLFSVASAYTAMRVARGALGPAVETEQFETQFAVLLKSFDAAKERINDLREFNKKTPFELPGLVSASVTLQTLTEGALAAGDGLRLVGDVAVATRQPIEELAIHIGRAYDGLNNNRPVGESLQRLQELGIVSGRTRTEIENLQKANADGAEVWAVLARQLERFRGTTELGSRTFAGAASNLSDTFRELRENFSTPIRDTLTPILQGVADHLDDFAKGEKTQAAGNAVAGFVGAAINAFRDGQFTKFVGLSIEAGIESASIAFRKIMTGDLQWFGSTAPTQISSALISGIITLQAEFRKTMAEFGALTAALISAVFTKVTSEAEATFNKLSLSVKILAGQIAAAVIETLADAFEKVFAALRVPQRVSSRIASDLRQAVNTVNAGVGGLKVVRDLEKVPSLMDIFARKWVETSEAAEKNVELIEKQAGEFRKALNIHQGLADEAERELTARKELAKLASIATRQSEAAEARSQTEKDKILQNSQGQGGESPSNPESPLSPQLNPAERMAEQILQFQEVTTAAATVMRGMFNGISNSIQGLINGTMRWGDALRNISGSIVQSIIQSFADMAAAYIVNQLIIQTVMKKTSAVGSALRAKETTQTIAAETSKKPALATNATLASIGSFGAAAIIGLALVTAAIAAMAGGFKSGGYTGDGPVNKVAGVVHGKEVVLHAGATRNYREIAEAMNAGARPEVLEAMIASKAGSRSALSMGASASSRAASSVRPQSAPASSGASPNLNVAIVDDRQSMREWATSTEGRRTLLWLTQQNQTELGLPS